MILPLGSAHQEEKNLQIRIKLDLNDDFVEQINQHTHTHPPSQTNCKVAKVRAVIKWPTTGAVMVKQQISAQQLATISEGAEINLLVVQNLHRYIRYAHQEKNLPPLSINITAIPVLPVEFQTKTNGDQFLLFDSGAGAADRIIAFA